MCLGGDIVSCSTFFAAQISNLNLEHLEWALHWYSSSVVAIAESLPLNCASFDFLPSGFGLQIQILELLMNRFVIPITPLLQTKSSKNLKD